MVVEVIVIAYFQRFKKCCTKCLTITLEENGRRRVLEVRGVRLLVAVLAAVQATTLHLEIPRQLVGREISDRLVSQ